MLRFFLKKLFLKNFHFVHNYTIVENDYLGKIFPLFNKLPRKISRNIHTKKKHYYCGTLIP